MCIRKPEVAKGGTLFATKLPGRMNEGADEQEKDHGPRGLERPQAKILDPQRMEKEAVGIKTSNTANERGSWPPRPERLPQADFFDSERGKNHPMYPSFLKAALSGAFLMHF